MMAGTDANVYLTVYGSKNVTPRFKLKNKNLNNFEKNNTDEFHVQFESLGAIRRIRIEHDNSGVGPGWFLDYVLIQNMDTGKRYVFILRDWIAEDEGDGSLFRDLYPEVDETESKGRKGKGYSSFLPTIMYEIQVITGNVTHAGTDARVYFTLYGDKERTNEVELHDDSDNFERGRIDTFKVRCDSLDFSKNTLNVLLFI